MPFGQVLNITRYCLLAVLLPSVLSAGLGIDQRLEQAFPFLKDRLSWSDAYGPRDAIDPQRAGAYGAGSGRVFCMLGVFSPLNTQSNLYGPTYQTPPLGMLVPTLRQDDSALTYSSQSMGWVRSSGVVAFEGRVRELIVRTYDFAPRDGQALIRLWEIENDSLDYAENLSLSLSLRSDWDSAHTCALKDSVWEVHQKSDRRETWWALGFPGEQPEERRGALTVRLPRLGPGARWQAAQVMTASFDADKARQEYEGAARDPLTTLRDAREEWARWNGSAASLSVTASAGALTRWSGLGDLLEAQKAILRAQQAHSGSFSPLIGYSMAWVRDNTGPILLWDHLGKTAEARGVLDFFHGAAARLGSLPGSFSVERRADPPLWPDHAGMAMEHSEVPSWMVLQHLWTFQADGDRDWIKKRIPFLKRCLDGQFITPEGMMLFQRDETYMWTLQSRTFPRLGALNGCFGGYAGSPEAAFLWIAAARGLAGVLEEMGLSKDALTLRERARWLEERTRALYLVPVEGYYGASRSLGGELNPLPFANILVAPVWTGAAGPEDEGALRSLLAGLHYLKPVAGRLKSSPWNGYVTGMTPGQWAAALARAKLPSAGEMLGETLSAASPSGDFSEIVSPEGLTWNRPEWGQGTSGRLRPWEGGISADAVLTVLSGFRQGEGKGAVSLAPFLPPALRSFRLTGLWTRDGPLDLDVERTGAWTWTARLKSRAGSALEVSLDTWVPGGVLETASLDGSGLTEFDIQPGWAEGSGEFTTLRFRLKPGEERVAVWSGAAEKPAGDREEAESPEAEPPGGTQDADHADRAFGPLPERTFADGPVVYFFSSGSLAREAGRNATEWPGAAVRFASVLRRLAATVMADLDLPMTPKEFRSALLPSGPKSVRRLAVFERGAMTAGTVSFKPEAFWNDPGVRAAARDFLQAGGCIVLGASSPEKPQRDVLPGWLVSMTGGFRASKGDAYCVPAMGGKDEMGWQRQDVMRPGEPGSEKLHDVKVEGERWAGKMTLPLWYARSKSRSTLSGRSFTRSLQFAVPVPSPGQYRVRVWLASHKPVAGLALEMLSDKGRWTRIGTVPGRKIKPGRFFLTVDFDLPALTAAGRPVLRLVNTGKKKEPHVFSVEVLALKGRNELAELLGYESGRTAGACRYGLETGSGKWRVPLKLMNKKQQAGLLVLPWGKGLVIKTEMETPSLRPLFTALLDPERRKQIDARLRGVKIQVKSQK